METVLAILGFLTLTFFLLASLNALKRFVKVPFILKLAKQHRIFGVTSAFLALIHMFVAVLDGELRITGALALIALICTAMMGLVYSQQRSKAFYIVHRIMGPLTLVLMIVHMILNSSV